jgi:glycerate 2-kinase
MPTPQFKDHRAHAQALIDAALQAADPAAALARHWSDAVLGDEVVLLAIGKGSRPMALEALRRLGPRAVAGLITTPPDQADPADFAPWPVRVMPCDHPFPTQRNLDAARAARDLISAARPHHTLLCLISGGGSAHLTLPADGLTIEDIAAVTKALQRAGATIDELNCIRKHCEQLKGGRLAVLSGARKLIAYILSDVMGDKLDVISSGPTVPDPTTFEQALGVLRTRGCESASPAVTRHLKNSADETPKPGHPAFARVTNTIIASNRLVVDAVAAAAASLGFAPVLLDYDREGEASEVGRHLASNVAASLLRRRGPIASIMGGETTVTVGSASGLGGPSQEIALAWAHAAAADGLHPAALLTLSTDGRDGPTDAAGAIVSTDTAAAARRVRLDLSAALANHDAYHALDKLGSLVRVPPTGTNLNHIAALLTYP